MLRIGICDDNQNDIKQICELAIRFSEEHPENHLQIQAYDSPFDLLDDIEDAVLDCIHRLLPTKNPSIILKSKTGLHRIPVYELVCIESFNHNQIVTLSDGSSLETSATLVELMEVLKDHPSFVRPHRAYIVNMDFIRKLSTRELLLTNGKSIPISQNRYKELKNSYFSYMIHS